MKFEFNRDAAWLLKGIFERRRWQPRYWAVAMRAIVLGARCLVELFLTSMYVWCSLRSVGWNKFLERTRKTLHWGYIVGFSLTILMVSLKKTSRNIKSWDQQNYLIHK